MIDRVHDDLLDAWLTEAMRLSHECTLAFSEMENDSEADHLPAWNAAKRKLREHLTRHPGPAPAAPMTEPKPSDAQAFGRDLWGGAIA